MSKWEVIYNSSTPSAVITKHKHLLFSIHQHRTFGVFFQYLYQIGHTIQMLQSSDSPATAWLFSVCPQ